MSVSTTDQPSAEPPATTAGEADAATAAHAHPTGLLRATAIIATIGVALAVLGLALMLRPVETPTQDCGTTLGFLLEGRTNVFVDPNDRPAGITAAEAKANNDHPCRERVADQVLPSAVLIGGGLVLAVVAATTEIVARVMAWRRRHLARAKAGATSARTTSPASG